MTNYNNNELGSSENINKNKNIEFIKDQTIIDAKNSEPEMMHTAENIVFRPLFSYRQVKEKRQRLHNRQNLIKKQNNSANRRSSIVTQTPVRYVYAYPYPGYRTQDYPTYYYPSYSRYQ